MAGGARRAFPLPASTCFIFPRRQEGGPLPPHSLLQKFEDIIRSCTLGKETEPTTGYPFAQREGPKRGRRVVNGRRTGMEKREEEGPQGGRSHPLLGHQQLLLSILFLDVVVLHLHLMRQLQPLLQSLWSIP